MARCYLASDNCFVCHWCCARLAEGQVVIDHWMPVARGGGNDPENLVVSCARCNSLKSDLPPDEAEIKINDLLEAASN